MNTHERLEKLMKDRNWTRYRLAKECGLSETTITNIFKRGNVPSIPTLETICKGFNITLSQFFADDELIEASPEIRELLNEWVFLTPTQKSAILHVMKTFNNEK